MQANKQQNFSHLKSEYIFLGHPAIIPRNVCNYILINYIREVGENILGLLLDKYFLSSENSFIYTHTHTYVCVCVTKSPKD